MDFDFIFTSEVWKRLIWSAISILVGALLYAIVINIARRFSVFHEENLAQSAKRARTHTGEALDSVKKSTQKARNTYAGLFKSLLRLCFVLGVTVVVLAINGVDVGSILAGIGIASVVTGLAVQDTLRDAIRGITIITEKYFQVGDVVTTNGITGVVLSIGILTTKMTDWDHGNAVVSISNRNIIDASVATTKSTFSVNLPHVMPQVEMARLLTDAALLVESDEKIKSCDYLGVTAIDGDTLTHTFQLNCAPKNASAAKRLALKTILTTLDDNRVPLADGASEVSA